MGVGRMIGNLVQCQRKDLASYLATSARLTIYLRPLCEQ